VIRDGPRLKPLPAFAPPRGFASLTSVIPARAASRQAADLRLRALAPEPLPQEDPKRHGDFGPKTLCGN